MMRLGTIEFDVLNAGTFRLDGGTVFGIVPRMVWERFMTPDQENRILLECRCLLVKTQGITVLVDTGLGEKYTGREKTLPGLNDGGLVLSLAERGIRPEDIGLVVLTHLHLDHAGGATTTDGRGELVPVFPRATYVVQRGEWEDACSNFGLMKSSYRAENFEPLWKAGRLQLVDGDVPICPGVRALVTGGHTRCHMSVLVESSGQKLWYSGDLMASHFHVPPHYVMAYDLFPLDVVAKRRELLSMAASEDWLIVWPHDPFWAIGRVTSDGSGEWKACKVARI